MGLTKMMGCVGGIARLTIALSVVSAMACAVDVEADGQLVEQWALDNPSTKRGESVGRVDLVPGRDGKATKFRGDESYLIFPHEEAHLLDQGTIAFWFKSHDTTGRHGLLSKDSQGYDEGGHLTFRTEGEELIARLSSASNHWPVSVGGVKDGQWYHVALTFGGEGMTLYLNGIPVDVSSYRGGLGESSGGEGNREPWVLGALGWRSDDRQARPLEAYFDGVLDDIRLFNRPLSAEKINAIIGDKGNLASVEPVDIGAGREVTAKAAGPMRFEHHYVDRNLPGESWAGSEVVDLTNNDLPDIVVARSKWGEGPDAIYWYRNEGDASSWSDRMPVKLGVTQSVGLAAFDVDQDGWNDVVTGGYWYRNPGKPGQEAEFERFRYGLGQQAHDLVGHDLDGNGRRELVVHLQDKEEGGVYVFWVPEDPVRTWPSVRVDDTGESVHAAIAPRGIGDVSGNGYPDIVFLNKWYENVEGTGKAWKTHENLHFVTQGKFGGPAVRCWVADINGDGHKDIVQSGCDMPKAPIAWFDNVNGDGSRWEKHRLPQKGTPGDYHSLAVADFDLDGDLDIYADDMEHIHVPSDRPFGMHIWENVDERGGKWSQRTIVEGLGGHEAEVVDFDNDGDPDIFTRPYTAGANANGGNVHLTILENLQQ